MSTYLLAFLIGVVSGLRTFTGIAAVSWAARLHWLHLENTALAFLGYVATPIIVTLLAVAELVGDQLPKTPNRTQPFPFASRVIAGALSGMAIGAGHQMLAAGLFAGVVGSLVGTLGGFRARAYLARAFGKDMPAAFLEDAVAIGLAFLVVTNA
jgi:uncharacterized membrane protein